jgi:hypothetical protein
MIPGPYRSTNTCCISSFRVAMALNISVSFAQFSHSAEHFNVQGECTPRSSLQDKPVCVLYNITTDSGRFSEIVTSMGACSAPRAHHCEIRVTRHCSSRLVVVAQDIRAGFQDPLLTVPLVSLTGSGPDRIEIYIFHPRHKTFSRSIRPYHPLVLRQQSQLLYCHQPQYTSSLYRANRVVTRAQAFGRTDHEREELPS